MGRRKTRKPQALRVSAATRKLCEGKAWSKRNANKCSSAGFMLIRPTGKKQNVWIDQGKKIVEEQSSEKKILGPGLAKAYRAAVRRGPCSVALSADRLRKMAKTPAAKKFLGKQIPQYEKRCDESID
jgi:hypothetical protein